MTIIDSHCHIASEEHVPRSFIRGAIANMQARLVAQGIPASMEKMEALYHAKMQDGSCDALVAEMDRAGIDKSILLVPDFTFALDGCQLTIEESYARHRAVLARHPGRFEVFGGMDPRWGRTGVDLFERSLTEFGFRGFKVYPPCGFSPSDPALWPFYEICAGHGVPVVVHIGPSSPVLSFTQTSPFLLDEAARRFPSVDFIMAHGSVSFTEECSMLCAFRPNIYLDISAYQSALGPDGPRGAVRAVVSKGINHKVLFGTDWPVFRLQADQPTFVDDLLAGDGPLAGLSDSERSLVLHGNAERLLARASRPAGLRS
jgi:predicted TIM-barrel fold metal-dependent hydrolase